MLWIQTIRLSWTTQTVYYFINHNPLQARIIVCRKFRVFDMIRANLLLRTHFSGLNPISHVTESVTPRIRLDMVRLLVTTNLCPTSRFNHLGFSPLICLCANGLPFWITFVRNFRGFVEWAAYSLGCPSFEKVEKFHGAALPSC